MAKVDQTYRTAGLSVAELKVALADLERAIINPTQSVSIGGETLTFDSVADIRAAIRYVRGRIRVLTNPRANFSTFRIR